MEKQAQESEYKTQEIYLETLLYVNHKVYSASVEGMSDSYSEILVSSH